jgi:translation initiation factor 4G
MKEEEDIESLCRLLTTVGKGLDNAKAKQHMDVYFSRMRTSLRARGFLLRLPP